MKEDTFIGTGIPDRSVPPHYRVFPNTEAIEIIQLALTPEEFEGYIKGNILKYRLRAGKKGAASSCLRKAEHYEEMLYGKG